MTSYSTKQDDRRFIRIPKETAVIMSKLEYPLSEGTVKAKTKNLSEKGICLLTSTQYQVDTFLNIEIKLQGWQNYLQNTYSIVDTATLTKPLTAIGVVEWIKNVQDGPGYEIGVRFLDIYEDDYRAFCKYLDALTKKM